MTQNGILYILYSARLDRYYIGSTNDVERRLAEHNRGHTPSTRTGIPWQVRFQYPYPTLREAKQKEYYLKSLKSRKIVEALVPGDQEVIAQYLAR